MTLIYSGAVNKGSKKHFTECTFDHIMPLLKILKIYRNLSITCRMGPGVSWWVPIPVVFAPISLRYFQFSKCFTFSRNPTPLHVLCPHSHMHLPCKTKLNDPWTINRFSFALCASLHYSPHHVLLKLPPNSTVRFLRLGLGVMLQPSPLSECLAWCQAQN